MDYNSLNSDDDFDGSNSFGESPITVGSNSRSANPNGLSKAELRKNNKPIMEKRRRARINHCLNELKSLILEAMKKDPARHTKLEKADILEMTVKHLQSIQRQQLTMAIQTDPSVIHKFKTGFSECTEEVQRYISQLDDVDTGVRTRLTNHLKSCANGLEQIGSMANFNNSYRSQSTNAHSLFGGGGTIPGVIQATSPLFPPMPQDHNNNSNSNTGPHIAPIQMGGVQLIPSRLPSGEFALIVPNSNAINVATAPVNNNNKLGSPPFITWSNIAQSTTTLPPQIIDISDSASPRLSAFTKPIPTTIHSSHFTKNHPQKPQPQQTQSNQSINHHHHHHHNHHNSSTITSPPLSPISSVSSQGDDSVMHTSSDFSVASGPTTPPRHDRSVSSNTSSGIFPTPPSSNDSSSLISRTPNLQQPQVSSTSNDIGLSTQIVPRATKASKRLAENSVGDGSTGSDSNDSYSGEPPAKKIYRSRTNDIKEECPEDGSGGVGAALTEDSMWRPW